MHPSSSPSSVEPESRHRNHTLLTSDELVMLTDFREAPSPLHGVAPALRHLKFRPKPFVLAGLFFVGIMAMSKPLDEREGLWSQPVKVASAASSASPAWQAFQQWPAMVLEAPLPVPEEALLTSLAPAPVAPIVPAPNPSPVIRVETSMPEQRGSSAGADVTSHTPATPSPSTNPGTSMQSASIGGTGNLLSMLFGGKQAATIAKELSSLSAGMGRSSSHANSQGHSGGSRHRP